MAVFRAFYRNLGRIIFMSVLCVGAVFSSAFGLATVDYGCGNCGEWINSEPTRQWFDDGDFVPAPADLAGYCSVDSGLVPNGWVCNQWQDGGYLTAYYSNSSFNANGNGFYVDLANLGSIECEAQCVEAPPPGNCTLTYNCGTNGTGSATDPGGGSYTCSSQVQVPLLSGPGSCSNTYGYSFNNWYCEYTSSGMQATSPGGYLTMIDSVECTAQWDDEIPITLCGNGNPPRTVILGLDPEDEMVGWLWDDMLNGGSFVGADSMDAPFPWGSVQIQGFCASNSGTYGEQGDPVANGNNDTQCWCRVTSATTNSTDEPVTLNNYPWIYVGQSSQTPCDPQQCAAACEDLFGDVTSNTSHMDFLHALYTKNICEYSVSYNCGGLGGQAPTDPNLYEETDQVTIESNANACQGDCDCQFDGWYCDNPSGTYSPGDPLNMPPDDVTCTALWTGCSVNYHSGNCPFDDFRYTDSGVDISAPYTPLTLSYINSQNPYTSSVNSGCYTFLGYNNSDPSGSNHPGQPDYPSNNGIFTPVSSIGGICDLYATCDLAAYRVIYHPGNCSNASTTQAFEVPGWQDQYTVLGWSGVFPYTSTTSSFQGWNTSSPASGACPTPQYTSSSVASGPDSDCGWYDGPESPYGWLHLYGVCCDRVNLSWLPGGANVNWMGVQSQYPQTCVWGSSAGTYGGISLPSTQPTRPGYTFNGWLVTNHTN